MKLISASLDLSKIDKTRIVEGKNGAKYYNMVIVVNDEKDQYGRDVSIQEGQTKEEREAKKKVAYIGNGKTVFEKSSQAATQEESDGLPF